MQTLYNIMVVIHIFSAILGMGPGFMLIQVVSTAQTLTELRHAYKIRRRLHVFVMIGGILLLITGLIMGIINPSLFKTGWYVMSIILYLIALAFGPIVLSPLSKPIKEMLAEHNGEDIPEGYTQLAGKLFRYERVTSFIFIIIILLMILKPSFS